MWESIRSGEAQDYDRYLLNKSGQVHSQKLVRPSDQGYTEVPTAPLSEEDSIKLRQKKLHKVRSYPKPQSRGNPVQARALELELSTAPSPFSTDASTGNSLPISPRPGDEEGIALPHTSESTLLPLQDINTSVNSPRRRSTSSIESNVKSASSKAAGDSITKPAVEQQYTRRQTPDSVIPPPSDVEPASVAAKEPNEDMVLVSEMLARRKQPKPMEKRKPPRQLGRAASSRSAPSTADGPDSRASSVATEDRPQQAIEIEAPPRLAIGSDYQPSQELGWDAPGAQEARECLIRAMGGTVQNTGMKIGSIGVVQDVIGGLEMNSGRDQRAGRRRRG